MEFAGNSRIICYLVIVMTVTVLNIRMNPRADKRILCSDWLPETYRARSEFTALVPQEKVLFWLYYSLCQAIRQYNGDVLKRAKRKLDTPNLGKISPHPPRFFRIFFPERLFTTISELGTGQPYYKSLMEQACLVKVAVYWRKRNWSISSHLHRTRLGQ